MFAFDVMQVRKKERPFQKHNGRSFYMTFHFCSKTQTAIGIKIRYTDRFLWSVNTWTFRSRESGTESRTGRMESRSAGTQSASPRRQSSEAKASWSAGKSGTGF